MNEEFVPYEQSLELKELGFDEPCITFYEPNNKEVIVVGVPQRYNDPSLLRLKDFCAPTFSQAFRWFRDRHKKLDYPEFYYDEQKWHCHSDYKGYVLFNTYEEAELACLKKLIQIVKENKQ